MNGRRWMVLAAVVGVSTLSACASQGHDSDETLPTYTPPAWMAEVRAQNEEYANAGWLVWLLTELKERRTTELLGSPTARRAKGRSHI